MNVSIFGLGYVGSVSVGCLASLGHRIIGVDINPMKVEMINAGKSPVIEAGLEDLVSGGVASGRIRAVTQAEEGVLNSDISLVCVGTPSAENGNLDLTFVERVCRQIGQALPRKNSRHTVVIRSTILPGSVEGKIIPILEEASGLKAGQDFGISFNPEFLREGVAVKDFYHPPYTVIGQYRQRRQDAEFVAELYQAIDAPLLIVPLKVAETVKYANNAFHALKVTFANEIGVICKAQGIDSHQVMDIFCMDTHLNLSPYYLKPGYAFGGSCLPKDLRALLYLGHHLDLQLPVLESILPSNALQIKRGLALIQQTQRKKIGVLGLGFKAGTDDLRESPLVELVETLIGKGYQVVIYDSNVSMARLHGANRMYIEQEIPHITSLMRDSVEDVLAESEVLVIGNKSPEFQETLRQAKAEQFIIDLVRIRDQTEDLPETYTGIAWR